MALLDLEVVQQLAVLLCQLGESEMTIQMGLQALYVLVDSGTVQSPAYQCLSQPDVKRFSQLQPG